MNSKTLGMLAVIILYLIMMIAIGIYYSRKNKDVTDFYLGSRKLGPLVTAMSAEASDMSSWLLMSEASALIAATSGPSFRPPK